MKRKAIFIALYTISFFILSLLSVKIFDNSRSMEMFGFVFWANIMYLPLNIGSWILTLFITTFISNNIYRFIANFLSGLLVINLLGLIAGGKLLLLALTDRQNPSFQVSWAVHIIYIICFTVAYIAFIIRPEDKPLTT